jgi:hypothetical protein
VLSVYILSLHKYSQFMVEHDIQHEFNFVAAVCQLVSSRPHVCIDAMEINSELQSLILGEITGAFEKAIKGSDFCDASDMAADLDSNSAIDETELVVINIANHESITKKIIVTVCLVRAAVVVASNWRNCGQDEKKSENNFKRLLGFLIIPPENGNGQKPVSSGLANAVFKCDNKPTASIEDVSPWFPLDIAYALVLTSFFLPCLGSLVDFSCESKIGRSCQARCAVGAV